jgi:hypothetical protein
MLIRFPSIDSAIIALKIWVYATSENMPTSIVVITYPLCSRTEDVPEKQSPKRVCLSVNVFS